MTDKNTKPLRPNLGLTTDTNVMAMPAHITTFVERQNPVVASGMNHIWGLKTEAEFLSAARQLQGLEQAARIARGFLYLAFQKEHTATRTFLAFLLDLGVSKSSAYDLITEAQIFAKLKNEDECTAVAALSNGRIRELRHLSQENLNAFVQGEPVHGLTFDEAQTLTPKEINNTFAQKDNPIKKQLDDTKTQLETANNERDALLLQKEYRKLDGELPEGYVTQRVESRSQAYAIGLGLESLEELAVDAQQDLSMAGTDETAQLYANAAATGLYCHVKALAARFVAMEQSLLQRLPAELTGGDAPLPAYSKDEIDIATQRERVLRGEHQADKASRALDRKTTDKR